MVAAIPLLGLMAGVGAQPFLKDWARERRGRAQADAIGGLTDPGQINRALFEGGFLDAGEFTGNDFSNRNLAETTRQFDANHALSREKFAENVRQHGLNYALQARRQDLAEGQQRFAEQTYWGEQVQTVNGAVSMPIVKDVLFNMESGHNPNAVSHKGASGVGQIMPANIVPWTREMFPEYANVSDAGIRTMYAQNINGFQSRLAEAKFGQYLQGGDGLRGALVNWHAGQDTDWQDVVRDYADAQRTGNTGRYHDGNMHTYDYVRKIMNQYNTAAGQAQAQFESDEAFRAAVQPRLNLANQINHGLTILDDLPMNVKTWTSAEDVQNVQLVNRLILQQRNDFFREQMERTDTPGEVENLDLETLFPTIGSEFWKTDKEQARAVIEQNLQIYLQDQRNAIEAAQGPINRGGMSTPTTWDPDPKRRGPAPAEVVPQVMLPEGWEAR